MKSKNLIPIDQLCVHYDIELSFFSSLSELGLVEIQTIEQNRYIEQDQMESIEKMIRMHRELNINFEGIDTVMNLLEKINALQKELISTKNRLRLYED